jgi:hypothetical protein
MWTKSEKWKIIVHTQKDDDNDDDDDDDDDDNDDDDDLNLKTRQQ